ncbi:hypothetical protein K431DRAFT_101162 [Polychaeton citri CBS 116435]|uniref:3-methylcrotonyl-CoA carboxylase n=1 Tax=Polychaeton citri CBS 116435 TaxID=1314669 RepID=A0A9P4UU60_9PEZI|nr:hypothetical protein K431DRAFT_101162 [Polychaeton citri CBS 116435]
MRSIAITARSRAPAVSSVRRQRRWRATSTADPSASSPEPLRSILIANRGEIALRVNKTATAHGIRTTTLYTDPDREAQHALSSPFAVNLGSTDQYLNGERIISIAREQGCQAIHPGYGFLSENAAFARMCEEAGVKFIGPSASAIEAMGDKARSKEVMEAAGVPCIPGYHGSEQSVEGLEREAEKVGFPVLLKAVKGGGGKGMRIAMRKEEFRSQLESAKSEARSSFGDDIMLVEKYIQTPRHIEVQVFADEHGNCVALGERDCSLQRRHQKILEESPAPNLDDKVRKDLWEKARQAALAVAYTGAGTVEFIFDNDTGEFFFMEMNTRLQVEHPVTEMVTGLDLVRWQILVAEGGKLPLTQEEVEVRIAERGHAIEARIYAEDPSMNFIPSTGMLIHLRTPTPTESVRIDAGFVQGDEVSAHYDPMIAKLIVSGHDRKTALQKLRSALEEYEVVGPTTNIEFLKRCCASPAFVAGEVETGYIPKHRDELFAGQPIEPEVWAQAAIALYEDSQQSCSLRPPFQPIGFSSTPQPLSVTILKTGPDTYSVTLTGSESLSKDPVTFRTISKFNPASKTVTSYFPHTRLDTTVIRHPASISPTPNSSSTSLTLFNQGKQHNIHLATPSWLSAALGTKEVSNSVLAPMPCKVLRVEVEEGQEVAKDQPLVVIESMKMETVIRSPGVGVVRRVVHGVGDVVKAGVALVEFEGTEGDGGE